MKLKYISSIALGLGLAVSSCDVTNLSPLDSMTDASYWNTTTDLQLYANGLLGNLGGPSAWLDASTDLFVWQNPVNWMFDNESVNDYTGNWDWGVIRSCNYFLDRYEQVTGEQAEINQYVGEVRFIRALQYYAKIQQFGDVPWIEHEVSTTDDDILFGSRDARNYVLGKIIEDLQFAAQWCVQGPGYASGSTAGRPTGDAALQQLARICLYYGTYMKYHNETESNGISSTYLLQLARDASQQIMNTGRYSIVQGQNSFGTTNYPGYPLYYQNQFVQESLQGNEEAVLPRYYVNNVLMHGVGRQAGGGGNSGLGLSKAFIEMFLMADGTPIYNSGSGYQGDATIFDEVEGRDPRLWQIIATNNRPNYIANISDPSQEQWAWGTTISPVGGNTGYPCEKYHSSDLNQQIADHSYFDWFLYRYAEVLLINAEANYELGSCTQTVLDNTINLLRDRVEMAHLTVNPVADVNAYDYGYTVEPLLYEIRRERAIELISEGHRLDDLKRWNAFQLLANPLTVLGVAVTPESEAFYAQFNVEFGPGARMVYTYNGKNYLQLYQDDYMNNLQSRVWTPNDKRWLYPIPLTQLRLNPALGQNPGWPTGTSD